MATAVAFEPINFDDPDFLDLSGFTIVEQTTTLVVLEYPGGEATVFSGNFTIVGGEVVGGTINRIDGFVGNVNTFAYVPDPPVDAVTVIGFYEVNDGPGLLAFLFAGPDVLFGSAGNDLLRAFDGNDVIVPGDGINTIFGGAGFDLVDYFDSTAAVQVNLATGTGTGGFAQGDTYDGIEDAAGSNFADILTGNDLNNFLFGEGGDDTLDGGAGDDVLNGGAGADALIGGTGFDVAAYGGSPVAVDVNLATGIGTGGDATGDTYDSIEDLAGSDFDDTLTGDDQDNVLFGEDGNDTLIGGAGDDVFFGGDGSDIMQDGGAGDDVFWGGLGNDWHFGGEGFDTVVYLDSPEPLTLNLETNFAYGGFAWGDRYDGIEEVVGTAFDDRMWGSARDETLHGEGANDIITAGGGNDTLFGDDGDDGLGGEDGNDRLFGGAGNDRLSGGEGDDTLDGGEGADTLNGNAGVDTASYASASSRVEARLWRGEGQVGDAAGDVFSGIENLEGSQFDDLLSGDYRDNVIAGGDGDDRLFGSGGDDLVLGGAGNDDVNGQNGDDVLEGGAGGDVINGGAGIDTASYAGAASRVAARLWRGEGQVGDAAGDTFVDIENLEGSDFDDLLSGDYRSNRISGGDGDDSLFGSGGDDLVLGGAGNDDVNGQNGDDVLEGGVGGDIINGGAGVDTASYAGAASRVEARLSLGAGQVGDALGDTYIDIENLEGSQFDDLLSGDAGDNVIAGGAGGDIIDGGAGIDTASYADAASRVEARLWTGAGQVGEAAGDSFGNIENLEGSRFNDLLSGNSGENRIDGGDGDDRLFGSGGDDLVLGGAGNDDVNGQNGDDVLQGGAGGDVINGGAGIDTASYAEATSRVEARLWRGEGQVGEAAGDTFIDIENLEGSRFNDLLSGDYRDNWIDGGDGNDRLFGSGGNDRLSGGAGNDVLNGQNGDDVFVFLAGDAQDQIGDFDAVGNDRIDATAVGLDTVLSFETLAASGGDVNTVDAGDLALGIAVTASGGDLVLDFGGGDQLTVVGVSGLLQDDFVFTV